METYYVEGIDYTKDELNAMCAKILKKTHTVEHMPLSTGITKLVESVDYSFQPCYSISDCECIIDKMFDGLMGTRYIHKEPFTTWLWMMKEYKCDKLTAAVIYFIEESIYTA